MIAMVSSTIELKNESRKKVKLSEFENEKKKKNVRFLKIVISIICSHVSLPFLYITHVNKYIPRFLIIFNFGNITKRFILL